MRRPVIASLLSAFVFPGAGHLYLRRPLRACVFLLPSLVAATWYFGDMLARASSLADQVMAGTVAPDPAALAARLEAQGGSPLAALCGMLLLALWLAAIVDSFMVARAAERGRE
ncbi:MAG: DUF6677 family protein [Massilia sp.]